MDRILILKNEKDFREELRYIGIGEDIPWSAYYGESRFFVKLEPIPVEWLSSFSPVVEKVEGSLFPAIKDGTGTVLVSISKWKLEELLRELQNADEEVLRAVGERIAHLYQNFNRTEWRFTTRGKEWVIDRPLIMGIVNVTPDSFSDGGKYFAPEQAIAHGLRLIEEGAQILDIGGESTRPGAEPVPLEEEWRRIGPVIEKLALQDDVLLSVDTYKSEIARRALEQGAHIINDISALTFDPGMVEIAARYRVPVILMHIKGQPRSMQQNPAYENLMDEIYRFLDQQTRFAREHGVEQLLVDPGIGFGKRLDDNFEIIRRIAELRSLGYPILVGPSRKSFISGVSTSPPGERLPGTIAACLMAMLEGARIFRVHDVKEVRQSLAVLEGILNRKAQ